MTAAGVKMEFADTGWTMRDGGRQVVGRAARMDEIKEVELETMSLGELMYFALVGKG
jgi:hypothetical protein